VAQRDRCSEFDAQGIVRDPLRIFYFHFSNFISEVCMGDARLILTEGLLFDFLENS
jgi:hypothetical protein